MEGWIKLHRKALENPIVFKDSDHIAVWVYLLLMATHREKLVIFGGQKVTLKPGQLITGRKSISEKIRVSESKIQRILSAFENEQQIEQQTSNRNRLITIVSWSEYQESEQQIEPQMNNKRTTDEQPVNTNKNERMKELKNERSLKDIPPVSPKGERTRFKPPTLEEVIAYCEERQNNVDAGRWFDFYVSKGWMVGRNKMKDWKAAVRTWEKNSQPTFQHKGSSFDVLQQMVREGEHEQAGRVEVDNYMFG